MLALLVLVALIVLCALLKHHRRNTVVIGGCLLLIFSVGFVVTLHRSISIPVDTTSYRYRFDHDKSK